MSASFKHEIFTKDGVTFIKVQKGTNFSVTFADLGASLYEIYYKNKLMTLTPKYINDFKKTSVYNGKTIGRVSNRIKNAEIVVDNILYKLDPNENGNTLHGGRNGISSKYFDYEVGESDKYFYLSFTYLSPHLEGGFPEDLNIEINYLFTKIINDDSFCINLIAKSDRVTPIKLTNHLYFTLGEPTAKNLFLSVYTNSYLDVDKQLLPLGRKRIKGNLFHFNGEFGPLDDALLEVFNKNKQPWVDHYFFHPKTKNRKEVYDALLYSSDIVLAINSTFGGMQVYNDFYEDDIIYKNTSEKSRRGFALEPSLPNNELGLFQPGSTFNHKIVYTFYEKKNNKN